MNKAELLKAIAALAKNSGQLASGQKNIEVSNRPNDEDSNQKKLISDFLIKKLDMIKNSKHEYSFDELVKIINNAIEFIDKKNSAKIKSRISDKNRTRTGRKNSQIIPKIEPDKNNSEKVPYFPGPSSEKETKSVSKKKSSKK